MASGHLQLTVAGAEGGERRRRLHVWVAWGGGCTHPDDPDAEAACARDDRMRHLRRVAAPRLRVAAEKVPAEVIFEEKRGVSCGGPSVHCRTRGEPSARRLWPQRRQTTTPLMSVWAMGQMRRGERRLLLSPGGAPVASCRHVETVVVASHLEEVGRRQSRPLLRRRNQARSTAWVHRVELWRQDDSPHRGFPPQQKMLRLRREQTRLWRKTTPCRSYMAECAPGEPLRCAPTTPTPRGTASSPSLFSVMSTGNEATRSQEAR